MTSHLSFLRFNRGAGFWAVLVLCLGLTALAGLAREPLYLIGGTGLMGLILANQALRNPVSALHLTDSHLTLRQGHSARTVPLSEIVLIELAGKSSPRPGLSVHLRGGEVLRARLRRLPRARKLAAALRATPIPFAQG